MYEILAVYFLLTCLIASANLYLYSTMRVVTKWTETTFPKVTTIASIPKRDGAHMPKYQTYQDFEPLKDRQSGWQFLVDQTTIDNLVTKYHDYKPEIQIDWNNGNGFKTTMHATDCKVIIDAVKVLKQSDKQLFSKPHYAYYK